MHVKGKCFAVTVLIHRFFLAASARFTVNLGNTDFYWHASGRKTRNHLKRFLLVQTQAGMAISHSVLSSDVFEFGR